MSEDNGYPGIQVSFFLGDPRGKNQQVVIRGENPAAVADQLEALTSEADGESVISRIINSLNTVQAANMLLGAPNYSSPPAESAPARQSTWSNRQNNSSSSGNTDGLQCQQCGAPAQRRSGEKNGKTWSGVFCTDNKQHVQWGK